MPEVTIVDVGYRSTHYWVVSAGTSRLLVDLGWPGSMGEMRASLARELKQAGVALLVLPVQASAIPAMKRWTKPRDRYVDITMHDNVTISLAESRALLAGIGIPGEIVHTPGHSEDSVSLLFDDGSVLTGDLTHPDYAWEDDAAVVLASWRMPRERGAMQVCPAHGPLWSPEEQLLV